MSAAVPPRPTAPAHGVIQSGPLALFAAPMAAGALWVGAADWRLGVLAVIGGFLGLVLYHGSFGFTAAYRRAFMARDMGAVRAHVVMLALAMVLFAPLLAEGRALGGGINGALAPADGRVVAGAFLFGLGMQIAGGCASGTMYALGGGSLRMALTLAAFCAGGFWATFDLAFWNTLPGLGTVAFNQELGWGGALALSLGVLAVLWWALGRLARGAQTPLGGGAAARGAAAVLRGPWPLLWAAVALALLNFATLIVAGHPWSITWGLTLWAAKAAQALGWAPETSAFWADGFPARALAQPVWRDTTSVMNAAIILGAGLAASLAGRLRASFTAAPGAVAASLIGGLLLGYGARLAYGCNIGALFSGIASQSLHGWVWLAAALAGTWTGIHLRPFFGLAKDR